MLLSQHWRPKYPSADAASHTADVFSPKYTQICRRIRAPAVRMCTTTIGFAYCCTLSFAHVQSTCAVCADTQSGCCTDCAHEEICVRWSILGPLQTKRAYMWCKIMTHCNVGLTYKLREFRCDSWVWGCTATFQIINFYLRCEYSNWES